MKIAIKMTGRLGPELGTTEPLCQVQAFVIQHEIFASVLIHLVMALIGLYVVHFDGSVHTIRTWEPAIISLCFIIPCPFSFTILFARPNGVDPMYGDVDTWCWISRTYVIFQMYFWFIILWIIFGINLIAYFLTWRGLVRNASVMGHVSTK